MSLEKLIRFSEIVGRLKTTKRSGWVSHVGISNPESVADHSFRCAILAICIGDLSNIETEKLTRMLLLHDVQEALTGDYDHYAKMQMGIDKVKSKQRIAIDEILSSLPEKLQSPYRSLWDEFENQTTPEAILANDIDKIEMMMQALEYEEEGYEPAKLDVFWSEVKNKIKTPLVQDLFRFLINKRRVNRT